MKKTLLWLNRNLEEVILVFGIILMIVVIFLQVVARYFVNMSLPWSEELARYVFVWQVWLAVPYTVIKGRHIRLELLPEVVGPKAKYALDMVFFGVSAGFFAFLCIESWTVTQGIIKMNQLTPVMHFPKWICYLSVPVGSALAVFRFIQYGVLRTMRYMKDHNDTALFVLDPDDPGF